MNTPLEYDITYDSPIAVKDEPHRKFDTLDGWQGEIELKAVDYGQICDVGQVIEFESFELSPVEDYS